jgi:hypothetical protein
LAPNKLIDLNEAPFFEFVQRAFNSRSVATRAAFPEVIGLRDPGSTELNQDLASLWICKRLSSMDLCLLEFGFLVFDR